MNARINQQKLFDAIFNNIKEKEIYTNIRIGAFLQDSTLYHIEQTDLSKYKPEDSFPIGKLSDFKIFVNPNMKWSDCRITDKNNNTLLDVATIINLDYLI